MNGGAMTIRLLAVSALLIVITGPAYASEENAISLGSSRRSDIDSVLMSWQLGENIPAVPQCLTRN
jgi:aconitase B